LNTLTDGDVRRGILGNLPLDSAVTKLLEIKQRMPHPVPVTGSVADSRERRVTIMQQNAVRQLPILDPEGRVVAIESLNEMLATDRLPLNAVVMAGGFGKRLHPLTEDTPKPMLLVQGRPVLEHIVENLSRAGIHQLHVTTHFKPEKIVDHFGDGRNFGVNISYLNEDSPLGTAGAIGMMPKPDEDVLVMNGDIISDVDFVSMFDFHREHRAAMTLGVQVYEHTVPYGVVQMSGGRVVSIQEKPCQRWFVNAGIYILAPSVFRHVNCGERLDMPELISRVMAAGLDVVSFPLREHWIDIGQPADYERAQKVAVGTI
jgi:NDP-sugar pyrophosphorylase family protein